jgi:flavin reductase (DIM6/NTAB) family NADH-FMN oxidoreductase RutF
MKDTISNIEARGQHTIALPTHAQLEAVEATSAPLPHGESEFLRVGLQAEPWEWPIPRPAGVRAALGCTVDRIVPIAGGPQRVVLARVHVVWVDDVAVFEDHRGRAQVDAALLDPLLRLGAGTYASMGPTTRAARTSGVTG